MSGQGTRRGWRSWVTALAPYVIAATAIALILRKYPIGTISREMSRGTMWPLFPIALVTFVATLLIMTVADTIVCRGLLGAPRARDVLRARAATVLLHMVHYAAGQSAYAVWIARKTGSRAGPAAGIILFIVAGELAAVCIFTTLLIAIARPDLPGAVLPFTAIMSVVLILLILVAPLRLGTHRIADFFDRFALFHAWTRGNRGLGMAQLGARVVQATIAALGTALAARAFGLEIPLGVLMTYLPIIGLVNALPVNVLGFGAVQATWLLLEPWAPGEQILAFSVLWSLAIAVALFLRGIFFLRGVTAEIRAGAKASADAAANAATDD